MITQNKSKSTNHHHKSIRFQIDLPSIEHHHHHQQQQQQQLQQQPVQLTPTIHLHINIDHSGQFSAKKPSQTTRNRFNHQLNSTTSGYSSSGLSSSGSSHSLNSSASGDFLEYDDANNRGFCCDNQQLQKQASKQNQQQTAQTVLANPNCYDKLSYVARGGANVVADESTLPTANVVVKEDVENIYEEISTFLESSKVVSATPIYVNQQVSTTTEKPRSSGSNYENLRSFSSSSNYCRESNGNGKTPRVVMKPMTSSDDDGAVKASSLHQQKRDMLKREYTLNEIFENLKKFKKQAKEQEMLNEPVAAAVVTGSRKMVGTEFSRARVNLKSEHVYENQRVIRNATFV
jgi:hypothetical protein